MNRDKLKVRWIEAQDAPGVFAMMFVATHPRTNVRGYGKTPGAAIRDWKHWWTMPY